MKKKFLCCGVCVIAIAGIMCVAGCNRSGDLPDNSSNSIASQIIDSSNKTTKSKKEPTFDGEIPCATTWYTSTNFGFSYQTPIDFEEDTSENENGIEITTYTGEDAEGNDLTIIITAVTKEIGMKNIAESLVAVRDEGISLDVDDSDNLITIEKKSVEYYKNWLKSEHEKLGYVVQLKDTSNGYKFIASLPTEENSDVYEEQYIINRELYDDGERTIIDATDQIHIDSDNEVQDHKWIGCKVIDCGNYIISISAIAEAFYDEDINPSVSKLKYIINQFN